MIDLSAAPLTPTRHQRAAVECICTQNWIYLCDEMGMGKTKTIIDSCTALYRRGDLDRVIVIAPASVVPVWIDPELGQLAAHAWPTIPTQVQHYHRRRKSWQYGPASDTPLQWIVTNYEFIRTGMRARSRYVPPRLATLLEQCGPRTMLVLDESSAVKTARAYQTRACKLLRAQCGRVALLTGTPIAHSPLDLLSQGNLLHPSILSDTPGVPCTLVAYRARYCVMGGWQGKEILEWKHLDDLTRRFSPYTLRRLKKDCLDLPAKLDAVTLTVPLSADTWRLYKGMRDQMIVRLRDAESVSVAQQAITKLIRLSQLTSGFLGGVEGMDGTPTDRIEWVSREKLMGLLEWYAARLDADPAIKLVIWCRFRAEVEQVAEAIRATGTGEVGTLWGSSPRAERDHALRLLHPQTAPAGAGVLVGTPSAGSMGITLAAAHTVIYLSNAPSLNIRVQSEDRTHRPGQTQACSYTDVVATGPTGQRTIDHIILGALRARRDLADWTASAWIDALHT